MVRFLAVSCTPHSRSIVCFNPRARGGRDSKADDNTSYARVSIHAPVGGATLNCLSVVHRQLVVSIHAPVGGATSALSQFFLSIVFQSTRPWGARRPLRTSPSTSRSRFNPRARGGRDCSTLVFVLCGYCFNPRARGGRDGPERGQREHGGERFNPRARGGRDRLGFPLRFLQRVSIHAPVGGATHPFHQLHRLRLVSIHAPVGGATGTGRGAGARGWSFNPRARGGRDSPSLSSVSTPCQFQSTRPWGARHDPADTAITTGRFQSTRPWGARLSITTRSISPTSFNPRARGGRDVDETAPITGCIVRFNPRARGGRDIIAN